jgi:hypothetical protein
LQTNDLEISRQRIFLESLVLNPLELPMEHSNKKFYSNEFKITFNLKKNGSIFGDIINSAKNLKNLRKEFSGIFIQCEAKVSLTFFTEIGGILTCFSGEFFHYSPNDECLWLRYWPTSELLQESLVLSDCKSVLLFDCPLKNKIIETCKVSDFLPNIAFA